MTLAQAAMKSPSRILGFERIDALEEARLRALGVTPGGVITKLLRTPLRDPVECLVGPQLLTMDAWLLERILVEPA